MSVLEEYGLVKKPGISQGSVLEEYGLVKGAEPQRFGMPTGELPSMEDYLTEPITETAKGIPRGLLETAAFISKKLPFTGISPEEFDVASSELIRDLGLGSTAKTLPGRAFGGAAEFAFPALIPGGVGVKGLQVAGKVPTFAKLGASALEKAPQVTALTKKAHIAGTAFGGGTAILEDPALTRGEITRGEYLKDIGKGYVTGTTFTISGMLPGPVKRYIARTLALGGTASTIEKRLPTQEELLMSAVLVGGIGAGGKALKYLAEKQGKTPVEVQKDVAQEAQASDKTPKEVILDRLMKLKAEPVRPIPEPTTEKGAERGIPQKAQEEVAPIPPQARAEVEPTAQQVITEEPSKAGEAPLLKEPPRGLPYEEVRVEIPKAQALAEQKAILDQKTQELQREASPLNKNLIRGEIGVIRDNIRKIQGMGDTVAVRRYRVVEEKSAIKVKSKAGEAPLPAIETKPKEPTTKPEIRRLEIEKTDIEEQIEKGVRTRAKELNKEVFGAEPPTDIFDQIKTVVTKGIRIDERLRLSLNTDEFKRLKGIAMGKRLPMTKDPNAQTLDEVADSLKMDTNDLLERMLLVKPKEKIPRELFQQAEDEFKATVLGSGLHKRLAEIDQRLERIAIEGEPRVGEAPESYIAVPFRPEPTRLGEKSGESKVIPIAEAVKLGYIKHVLPEVARAEAGKFVKDPVTGDIKEKVIWLDVQGSQTTGKEGWHIWDLPDYTPQAYEIPSAQRGAPAREIRAEAPTEEGAIPPTPRVKEQLPLFPEPEPKLVKPEFVYLRKREGLRVEKETSRIGLYEVEEVQETGRGKFYKLKGINKLIPEEDVLTQPELFSGGRPGVFPEAEALRLRDIEQTVTKARDALQKGDTIAYKAEMEKLSPAEQFSAHISTDLPLEKIPLRQKLNNFWTAIKDQFRPVQHMARDLSSGKPLPPEQDPYLLYRLSVGFRGKPETFLEEKGGTFDFKEGPGKLTGPSYTRILKPVANRLDDYRKYVLAKATKGREIAGKTTGVRADLSVQERIQLAEQAVRELEVKHPDFIKVHEQHQNFKRATLKYLADSGVISKDLESLWNRMYEDYTPMYRVMDTPGLELTGKGHGAPFQPIKRAKGSERLIIDPLESDIKNTYLIMAAAERNMAATAVADLAQMHAFAGGTKWAEKIKTPVRPVAQIRQQANEIINELGLKAEDLPAEPEQIITIFRPNHFIPKDQNITYLFRNGKMEFYKVEPNLFKAMQAIDTESSGILMRMMGFPAKLLRAGATLTPEFSLARNPLRDQITAFVYSKYGFLPGIDTARGLYHFLGKTDTYFRWKASGGEHAMLVSLDRNYLQHNLKTLFGSRIGQVPNLVRHPIEALRALSEATEAATRLGEFRLGELKEGLTKGGLMQAALASREVTLDFGRIGATGRSLNSIIAFWNAHLEGLDKLKRVFMENPIKASSRAMAGITLPSVLLWFANKDDERVQNLPQWQKDLFWIINIGEDKPLLRLPKPFELGIIFGTVPERMLDWTLKNDPGALKKAGEAILRGATPGIVPTAALVPIEQFANRSIFLDRPIVPRGKERLEPFLQTKPFSSEVSKLIGRTLNISPARIDHFIYGTTAGLGRLATGAVDVGLETAGLTEGIPKPEKTLADIPLVRAFIARHPSTQSQSIEDFYKSFNRTDEARSTLRKLVEDGEIEEARRYALANKDVIIQYPLLNKVNTRLSNYRKVMEKINQSRTLTPQQKRQMLDKIMLNMSNLTLGVMRRIKKNG